MENIIVAMSATAALEYFKKIEQENNIKSLDIDSFSDRKKTKNILSIDGDIAIIEIKGILDNRPLSFCDRFFSIQKTSYNDIIAAVDEIKDNDGIKNVKIIFDTPGGMVKGLDEAFQALFSLRDNRRVEAISQGDIFSAGYWLASAAHEITASCPSDMIGSIGVVVVTFDDSKMLEEIGIREITIRSKNAKNKIPDASTKKGENIIQGQIDSIERIFHQRITEGRGISTEKIISNFGNGNIFVAQDPGDERGALDRGMIDSVISRIKNNNPKDDHFPNNNTRGENMTYKELMVANSSDNELKGEVIAKLEERFQAGKAEVIATIKKVSPFLGADSKYPLAVKSLALKVLSGESSFAALEGAITVLDAQNEGKKSAEATKETIKAGETPAIPAGGGIDPEKPIETDAEIEAAAKRLKI
jgi:ClpP class serine protease